jgi:D-3-phosphoglycerate dehydrogenase
LHHSLFDLAMKILVGYPAEPAHLARIAAAWPECNVQIVAQADLNRQLPEADIFCGHAKVSVDWANVVRAGRLRWIQSSAAGLDHCLAPAIIHSDVIVSSASGVFADSVAEQALALLLGLVRKLHVFWTGWQRREFKRLPTDDLRGKTVCLVGLGGNGSRIAQVLRPLGVRILATDWFPGPHPATDQVATPEELPRLLTESDIAIITVPLTDQTRHLIGTRELSALRPGAYLINVARGPVVVEDALVDALQSGHLAGAGLDVTYDEPPRAESRLWSAPNLIVTPHVGAQSSGRVDRTTDLFCINLHRFRSGERVYNLVDKTLGFPAPEDRWRPQ